MLRAENIQAGYGGLPVLHGVTLEVARNESVAIIGANGAGKSTLMSALLGHLPVEAGAIEVDGTDVATLPAHQRARLGVGRIFQDARLFGDLTVTESIQVALEARERSELVPSLLGLPPSRRAERRKVGEAAELIAFLGLGRYADHRNPTPSATCHHGIDRGRRPHVARLRDGLRQRRIRRCRERRFARRSLVWHTHHQRRQR